MGYTVARWLGTSVCAGCDRSALCTYHWAGWIFGRNAVGGGGVILGVFLGFEAAMNRGST
jgi:hypothetical protein